MTDKMAEKNIEIRLGNFKDSEMGFIQNFEVYLDGKKITKGESNQSVIIINKFNYSLPIPVNDKSDVRYLKNNQAYVGHIFVKEENRGGLAKIIYQKIADELNVEIVKGDPISPQAKKMWNKFGDKISPQRN